MTGSLAQLCHVVPQHPPVKYDWNCSLMGSKFRESRVCCYPASTVHGYPLLPLFRTGSSSISAFETPPSVIEEQAIVLSAFYIFQPFLKSHQFFFFKIRISGPLKTCISSPQPFGFSSHKLSRNSMGLSLS